MNIKDRATYIRVKLNGTKKPILFNTGDYGLSQLLMTQVLREIAKTEHQTRPGIHTIEFTFDGPLTEEITSLDPEYEKSLAGLYAVARPFDEVISELGDESAQLTNLILNAEDKDFIIEYRLLAGESYRQTKSAEYIRQIKTHIEFTYRKQENIICFNLTPNSFWHI